MTIALHDDTRNAYLVVLADIQSNGSTELATREEVPLSTITQDGVRNTVAQGWLNSDVPDMMRGVMSRAHDLATSDAPEVLASGAQAEARRDFIKMIEVASTAAKPSGVQQATITNNVVLESLRELRMVG